MRAAVAGPELTAVGEADDDIAAPQGVEGRAAAGKRRLGQTTVRLLRGPRAGACVPAASGVDIMLPSNVRRIIACAVS